MHQHFPAPLERLGDEVDAGGQVTEQIGCLHVGQVHLCLATSSCVPSAVICCDTCGSRPRCPELAMPAAFEGCILLRRQTQDPFSADSGGVTSAHMVADEWAASGRVVVLRAAHDVGAHLAADRAIDHGQDVRDAQTVNMRQCIVATEEEPCSSAGGNVEAHACCKQQSSHASARLCIAVYTSCHTTLAEEDTD